MVSVLLVYVVQLMAHAKTGLERDKREKYLRLSVSVFFFVGKRANHLFLL